MSDEEFCFCCCVNLKKGCLILGITTFFMSLTSLIIACAGMLYSVKEPTFLQEWFDLQQNKALNTTISVAATVTAVVWLGLSLLFIHGVMKKNANYIISYFLFSCYLCLQFWLAVVLQIIAKHWITCAATLVFTLMYMRCMGAVYKIYGLILSQSEEDRKHLFDYNFVEDPGYWNEEIANEVQGNLEIQGPQGVREPQTVQG